MTSGDAAGDSSLDVAVVRNMDEHYSSCQCRGVTVRTARGTKYYEVHGEDFIIRVVDANEILEMSAAIDRHGDVASVNGHPCRSMPFRVVATSPGPRGAVIRVNGQSSQLYCSTEVQAAFLTSSLYSTAKIV